jgi:RNA polymerase sigma factor (sigma-70 family)
MPGVQLEPIAHFIRHAVQDPALTDAQLLARFASHRDEGAFAALVRRHGPLVLGVCRRVLRDAHAAEDAFQATFLLLARKAGSLAGPERLSSWLHGVAFRVATRARAQEAKRRNRESRAPIPGPVLPDDGLVWRELRAMLDEEIDRLPARQRDAVVSCYLEGQTNAEAAIHLGCPRGSVATLLARARQRLRRRLTGRGLALPAALACTWLARQAEAAAVPASLTSSTIEAVMQCAASGFQAAGLTAVQAVALAKGVVRAMFVKKLKAVVALVLVVAALSGAGAGLAGRQAKAQEPGEDSKVALGADKNEQSEAATPCPVQPVREAATVPPVAVDFGFPIHRQNEAATHRTANFEVTAPTLEAARKVAVAAERHRKALAQLWLGKELPAWEKRCPINVRLATQGAGGYSAFGYDDGALTSQRMVLVGQLDDMLSNTLPHEMTHVVLANWSGRPLPRWADEGASILAESKEGRARHAQALLTILDENRALRVPKLLSMMDYPPDAMVLFAQGYSLTDFLVNKGGRAKFLDFVKQGDRDSWARSARAHYGYATLAELEQAWLVHARKTRRAPAQVTEGSASWSSLSRHDRRTSSKLPESPAPVHALVELRGSRLTVWRRMVTYRPVTRNLPDRPGSATSYEQVAEVLAAEYPLAEVRTYDTQGKPVEKKKLAGLLIGETLVLVSADGKPIDPIYLRLVKEGTLVFVLPSSSPPAVGEPPVGAPPLAPAVGDRPAGR